MEQPPTMSPMPKKSCMITLMFPVTDDAEALKLKKILDEALTGLKEKRYTFQINET